MGHQVLDKARIAVRFRSGAEGLWEARAHTCARSDDGVVIVDVWQSREDFQTMMDDPEFKENLRAAGVTEPQLVEVYEVHASIPQTSSYKEA
ncbi:MAG TPA: antibiotic biosynthesis monooxygenase [Rubrobacteraceae bacterium]|nr:antibiotic biosynthesis monooxygenase [Rubrobacteraceae bacterium]